MNSRFHRGTDQALAFRDSYLFIVGQEYYLVVHLVPGSFMQTFSPFLPGGEEQADTPTQPPLSRGERGRGLFLAPQHADTRHPSSVAGRPMPRALKGNHRETVYPAFSISVIRVYA